MTRRYWLAVAAYVLPTFPLGYVWHLSVFKTQYDALGLYRDEVIIPLGLSAMILQGLIFASLYPKIFSTGSADWRGSAARFFLTFGVMSWTFLVLPVAAKYAMTSVPGFIALETGFVALHFAVVSPLIALVWRDGSPAEVPGLTAR